MIVNEEEHKSLVSVFDAACAFIEERTSANLTELISKVQDYRELADSLHRG
jgi:hypothetical protein